ncbi:hypothetical protein PQX77_015840 [Marasmius sp. AFHP31]|nr:hypothetical protein PQX77_015840 [Marasmius sp. AFHP31]
MILNLDRVGIAHRNLWDAIAGVGASHNAEQQYERGECLPGTREEVLRRIIWEWIMTGGQGRPISWLTGTAGVGKTAIAMTLAKACEQEGLLASSFFFFRSDPKRNVPDALILSIAHSLVSTVPFMRFFVEWRISRDPKILEARLEDQFHELVLKPTMAWSWVRSLWVVLLRVLYMLLSGIMPSDVVWGFLSILSLLAPLQAPNVVIIDGLDECSDENGQLRILSTIHSAINGNPNFPLRFLVCSRPESWLRQAFDALPPDQLFKVVLDESLMPSKDIMKYYRHHFREISKDPHYSQVPFPNIWPSEDVLEALVEHSSSQFVYAATVVKYIKDKFEHPIEQLCIIIDKLPPRRPGTSPYQRLDALYEFILSANPDREGVLRILAALLVLTGASGDLDVLEPSPAIIELVLGLPMGQVPLTLRAMHSILEIRGSEDKLRVYHTSFTDYLFDPARSGRFHVDIQTQRYVIARQWLQNLRTSKVRTYSPNQLYGKKTRPFFREWGRFCMLLPEPTRDLLEYLWNVDLASTFLVAETLDWQEGFVELVSWLRRYHVFDANESQGKKEFGEHVKADTDGRCEAKAHSRAMDKDRNGVGLVEGLVHKLQTHPKCFHLECPPGVSSQNVVVRFVVGRAAGCPWGTGLGGTLPNDTEVVRLTDCHCDLSGGNESWDSGHLAYQEACLQLTKAHISLFKELARSGVKNDYDLDEDFMEEPFMDIVQSLLLAHCRLDTELLSLCRTFFGTVEHCSVMKIDSGQGEEAWENMLAWIEAFPGRFAEEGEALKVQLLGLPWEQWKYNSAR